MTEGFERYPFPGRRGSGAGSGTAGFSRVGALLLGVFLSLLGGLSVAQQLRDGNTLGAILAANVCGVLAMLAFGIAPQQPSRRSFRYLNSVVLTRADRPPVDSWVHVAPTRALRLPLVIGFTWFSLGLLVATACALLQLVGVLPKLNQETGTGGLVLALLLLLPISAACVWVSWLLIWRRVRNGSFGTRPSGVTLGSSGIAVRVPGRDVEITWGQIISITPQIASSGGARHSIAMIQLQLARGSGLVGDKQMLAAEGYQVPSDALYTALRWYHAHPEARWELGRVEGQRRLENWRLDAVGALVRQPAA